MATYSVFLHSTGTGPGLWRNVPPHALGASRPWHPANLGYPPLPALPRGQPVTADDDAAHLARTLPRDATALRLYAHSYGGLVALKLARMLTIPLESLFLVEPVLFGALRRELAHHPAAAREVEDFAAHPWFLHDDARGGTAAWLEVFIDYWNRPGSWSRLPPALREAQLALGWKMYQEVRSCFLDPADFAAWRVPMPLTLAVGERTTAAAKAMVAALAAVNPHARVVQLAGVGHMAIVQRPEVVFAAMTA